MLPLRPFLLRKKAVLLHRFLMITSRVSLRQCLGPASFRISVPIKLFEFLFLTKDPSFCLPLSPLLSVSKHFPMLIEQLSVPGAGITLGRMKLLLLEVFRADPRFLWSLRGVTPRSQRGKGGFVFRVLPLFQFPGRDAPLGGKKTAPLVSKT